MPSNITVNTLRAVAPIGYDGLTIGERTIRFLDEIEAAWGSPAPPLTREERRKLAIVCIEVAIDQARQRDFAAVQAFLAEAIDHLRAL